MVQAVHPPATAASVANTVAHNTQISTNVHHPQKQPSNTANHIASTIAQSNVAKVVVTTNKII